MISGVISVLCDKCVCTKKFSEKKAIESFQFHRSFRVFKPIITLYSERSCFVCTLVDIFWVWIALKRVQKTDTLFFFFFFVKMAI